MTRHRNRLFPIALATLSVAAMLCLSDAPSPTGSPVAFTAADARIGRPLTPLSYAGVARRTTRRAVVGGAAVAGAAYYGAPAYGAPGCVQVVDPYGRIVYRCP
jgi:hypothetical protein